MVADPSPVIESPAPVARELASAERLIFEQLDARQEIVRRVGEHLLGGGGKRVRPMVCLLTARMFDEADERCVVLASAIELIHTATLLHDDVVDRSHLRRGRATANTVWSDEASILIGDFLYSRAFQLIASLDNNAITRELARTTNVIASGEVAQFINKLRIDLDEETYMTVIGEKTAVLFEASCRGGALLYDADAEATEASAAYGRHLGLAFQLIDDLLDYKPGRRKKEAGDDWVGGKLTLPVIHALAVAAPADAEFIREAFDRHSRDALAGLTDIFKKTKSLDYVRDRALKHVYAATASLDGFPESEYREALTALARRLLERE